MVNNISIIYIPRDLLPFGVNRVNLRRHAQVSPLIHFHLVCNTIFDIQGDWNAIFQLFKFFLKKVKVYI